MGNFANTLFSVLLGWVQQAVAWLWSLGGSEGASGLMGWILDNWLILAVGLCLLGVAVDLVVYIIRWQPYRVWRKSKGKEDQAAEEEPAGEQEPMQWVYATGEAAPEPLPVQAGEWPVQEDAVRLPVRPDGGVQRVFAARDHRTMNAPDASAYVQQGYRQAYFPPQWTAEEGRSDDGGTHG
ncbi:MAG: hypothetical protein IKK57_09880 [Clostridia bacterium]|nr:hypothetical protein [Clostridia bacterium]